MTAKSGRAALMAAGASVCMAIAACGGASDTTTATGTKASGVPSRTFPSLKLAWGVPDFLDPGLSYDARGWDIMEHVYLGLLTYKRVSGPASTELIPGLAEKLPEVSSDGLTYTFKLRPGLKYSDGTAVKASDFKSTIERLFRINSNGQSFYSVIQGADRFAKTKQGGITGIAADDATRTIVIRLTAPRGDFQNIVAMMFASIVPSRTPAKDQSTTPIPATGPYELTSYQPNRSFALKRNPNYVPIPGVSAGNPDRVQGQIIADDTEALQKVVNGEADYNQHTVPPDRIAAVKQDDPDQLKLYTPAGTRYFFLNHAVAPFDKLEARQAVNYGIDRDAIVGLYGGLAIPTQNYLPPSYPSYKKIDAYTYDMAKAKALVRKAGAVGTAVTVWGLSDDDISRKVTAYFASQLNAMGFKAKQKLLESSAYYTAIFTQKTKAQIGWNEWVQDYPHPADWFDKVLNGEAITPENNYNTGNVNVPELNQKINQLDRLPADAETNPQWAALDRAYIVDNAAMAAYVNQVGTAFFSKRMDLKSCYVQQVLYQWDWTQSCVR